GAPAASAVARQITPRTRFPPTSAYRTDSACAPSSGVSARSVTYDSISSRCSSGLRTLGLLPRLLDPGQQLLHPGVDLLELSDQLVVVLALGELVDHLLSLVEIVLEGHAAVCSRATRASTPLTSRAASSDA